LRAWRAVALAEAGLAGCLGGSAVISGVENESTRQSIPGPTTAAAPRCKITGAGTQQQDVKESML
jgi:hypothetical protein